MNHKLEENVQRIIRENNLNTENDYFDILDKICENSDNFTQDFIEAFSQALLNLDKNKTIEKFAETCKIKEQNDIDEAVNKSLEKKYNKTIFIWISLITILPPVSFILYWMINIWSTTSNMNDYLVRLIKIGETNSSNIIINKDHHEEINSKLQKNLDDTSRVLKIVESNSSGIIVNKDAIRQVDNELQQNVVELKQSMVTVQDIVKKDNINLENVNTEILKMSNKLDILDREIQMVLLRNKYLSSVNKNINSATETNGGN